ncbi:hypothetical protein ABTG83_20325, partial [Acinetobacter baumannii]
MIFATTTFFLSWFFYIRFADEKKFHTFYPTVLLAMYLASTVDLLGSHHYKLWEYKEEATEAL